MYCFCANYQASKAFDLEAVPEWLTVESNWQGYRIAINPWIADVARLLGLLTIEDSLEDWLDYLEGLGLQEVVPVNLEDFYESKLYGV
jgi:hypothetical protein